MKDDGQAGLLRSYRSTLEAFLDLATLAEGLVSAHRAGQCPSDAQLDHAEQQLGYARMKAAEVDRFLALWRETDGHVH